MKKFGYLVIGILALCMTVTQGEIKAVAQNTDRGNKVEVKHYYAKKKKNVEFWDIGSGYSRIVLEKDEYKVKKGNYRIIKKDIRIDEYNGRDKLVIEDLKGNILFQTYDSGIIYDIAIGKDSLYYSWHGELEKGIYKVKLPSGERQLIYDLDLINVYFEKIYKNWLYLDCSGDNFFIFLNLKNGKYIKVEHCFIKGKTLYYSIRQKGDERKLYRCNLDFTKTKYLGKYKEKIDLTYPVTMLNYDGKYVYFEQYNGHERESFEFKIKFMKNTKK